MNVKGISALGKIQKTNKKSPNPDTIVDLLAGKAALPILVKVGRSILNGEKRVISSSELKMSMSMKIASSFFFNECTRLIEDK